MLPEEVESSGITPETSSAAELLGPERAVPGEASAEENQALIEAAIPAREPFWGYTDLALVIVLLAASFVLIGLFTAPFVFAYPNLRADPTPLALPVQLAFYAALYFDFWLIFKLKYRRTVLPSLGWKRPSINLIWVGLGGVLLAFAVSAIGALLQTPKIENPFDKLTKTPGSLVLFAIVAALLAPIFEEMFFRGFLQPLFSRTFGTFAGILITAILFGALHGFEYSWVWQYAFLITVVGVALGFLRAKTGSIIPGAVMHACFNAVSVVALAFGKDI
jgi:membrane protease YdiL (CAAX protease family)